MRNLSLFLSALILSFAGLSALADGPAPAAGAAILPPDQVVQQTASGMLNAISSKKAELQKNPRQLYDVVGQYLLPHFDFALASQLVLGQAWRTASAEQRKAFQVAFYKYLVHGYADALLKGNYSDKNVRVEPWRAGSDPNRAYVKTKVLRDNAQPIAVDYSLHLAPDGWKAFDVVIEGISYVHSYHDQFAPEVQAKGLDELIQRLNQDADQGKVEDVNGTDKH